MLEKIIEVLSAQDMCVLATAAENMPHCSLMAYISDKDAGQMYMVTHKDTKKYTNLQNNPSVSILVDTRIRQESADREKVMALTVNGTYQPLLDKNERAEIREKFLRRHIHLKDFALNRQAVFFAVKIISFQLLIGAEESYFYTTEKI